MKTRRFIALFAILIVSFFSAFVFTASLAQAVPNNFAVSEVYTVDMQAVLQDSKKGKAATQRLNAHVAKSKEEVNELFTSLNKMRTEIERQAALLSDEAFKQKQEELVLKSREIQKIVDEKENETQKLRAKEIGDIVQSAQKVINDLGTKKGYKLIVETSSPVVMYTDKKLDLTKTIIDGIGG